MHTTSKSNWPGRTRATGNLTLPKWVENTRSRQWPWYFHQRQPTQCHFKMHPVYMYVIYTGMFLNSIYWRMCCFQLFSDFQIMKRSIFFNTLNFTQQVSKLRYEQFNHFFIPQSANETVFTEVMQSISDSLAVHVWHHNFVRVKKLRTKEMQWVEERSVIWMT